MNNLTVRPATAKQLRYLRSLAQRTGTTFTPPRDSREAGREITRMRRLDRVPLQPEETGKPPDDGEEVSPRLTSNGRVHSTTRSSRTRRLSSGISRGL